MTTVIRRNWKIVALLAGVLIVATGFLAVKAWKAPTQAQAETTGMRPIPNATSASNNASEPTPFDPKGAKSWTEWYAKANAAKDQGDLGMWKALADLHFQGNLKKAFAATKYQVTKEAELGLDCYVRKVPKDGLQVTNTSPRGASYKTVSSNLKPGDTYLVLDKDSPLLVGGGDTAVLPTDEGKEQPAIRRKCANPIKVGAGAVKKVRQAKAIPPCPTPTKRVVPCPPKPKPPVPVPCPDKRNPKATQPVQDNPPDLVKPTPGYTRGNAEQVVQDQRNSPPADIDSHPGHGSPGTGSGGSTPRGTSDGVPTPPPSADPPAPDYPDVRPTAPVTED